MMFKHIRRPDLSPTRGRWRIRCDCGWHGTAPMARNGKPLTGDQIQEALENAFQKHLPANHRSQYVLVDSRPAVSNAAAQLAAMGATAADAEELAAEVGIGGVFVMPEGTPVDDFTHYETDGVRRAKFRVGERRGDLPIGEIRHPDGRVFRLDE